MKSPMPNPAEPRAPVQNPRSVTVEIGELVLHGFAWADSHEIGEALQRELGQLLSKRGIPRSWNNSPDLARVNAASINMAVGAKSALIGKQVARAVYNQLERPASRASSPPRKS